MSIDEIISGLLRLAVYDNRYWWVADFLRSLYVTDRSAYDAIADVLEAKHFTCAESFVYYISSYKEVATCH